MRRIIPERKTARTTSYYTCLNALAFSYTQERDGCENARQIPCIYSGDLSTVGLKQLFFGTKVPLGDATASTDQIWQGPIVFIAQPRVILLINYRYCDRGAVAAVC